ELCQGQWAKSSCSPLHSIAIEGGRASADYHELRRRGSIGSQMPSLATAACMLFIVYLFWIDAVGVEFRRAPLSLAERFLKRLLGLRRLDSPSKALWVPLAWMFLAGSRFASYWLNLGPPTVQSANDYAEGSPVDAAVFFVLIMAGILILARRKIDWQRLLLNNMWIVLYLLYCLASMTW